MPRVLKQEWLSLLGPNPLILALANPEPEILPELVLQSRPVAMMASGRDCRTSSGRISGSGLASARISGLGPSRESHSCFSTRGTERPRKMSAPASTSAEDVLAMEPDGVFFSNGPGDPEPLDYAVENVQKLQGKAPIFGICLGHQIFGLALGGKTYKLKFGHHGGNHPIKNMETDKVEITAQNHNYAVDPDTLDSNSVAVTHVNLNDQTCAGLKHRNDPMFSVQYHPEASPGPHDSHYLFKDFRRMMEEWKK